MIRTTIEVEGKDEYEFGRNLKAALDELGYEPKPDEESTRWMSDVWEVIREQKIDVPKLVRELRQRRFDEMNSIETAKT